MQCNVTQVQFEMMSRFQMLTWRPEFFLYSPHTFVRRSQEVSICAATLAQSKHLLCASPSFPALHEDSWRPGELFACSLISNVSHMRRPPRCAIPLRDLNDRGTLSLLYFFDSNLRTKVKLTRLTLNSNPARLRVVGEWQWKAGISPQIFLFCETVDCILLSPSTI